MSLDAPKDVAIDGSRFSIGIVAASFNRSLVDALLESVVARFVKAGVRPERTDIVRVPGSHEVPIAASWLARSRGRDCVVGLGVLLKGATGHHKVVGAAVAHALQRVALDTGVPVINGVIVVDTLRQAEARTRGGIARGDEFARAALAMAGLRRVHGRRP